MRYASDIRTTLIIRTNRITTAGKGHVLVNLGGALGDDHPQEAHRPCGCNGVHVAESIKTPPPLYCTTSPKHNDGSFDKACSGWGRGAGLRARRHRPTSPSTGFGASGTVRLASAAR
eukprot:scaffold15338_cov140-Isochrysis_galbana.AAC.1